MKRLKDHVTIITGGGKGIGFGLAEAFAEEGSNLVLTGRTESRLVAAKEGIRGLSRVAAAEWGPDGIRVNVICPLAILPILRAISAAFVFFSPAKMQNMLRAKPSRFKVAVA